MRGMFVLLLFLVSRWKIFRLTPGVALVGSIDKFEGFVKNYYQCK